MQINHSDIAKIVKRFPTVNFLAIKAMKFERGVTFQQQIGNEIGECLCTKKSAMIGIRTPVDDFSECSAQLQNL